MRVYGTNAFDTAVGRHPHADKAHVYFVSGKGLPPYCCLAPACFCLLAGLTQG